MHMRTSPSRLSRMRLGLGTLIAIDAEADDATLAEHALAAAFEAVSCVDALMHPTRGLDMIALSTASRGEWVPLHPWTFEVLRLSRRLHDLSAGIFDPCLPGGAGRIVDLDLSRRACARVRARVHLDLGGIAKGYAVDRALRALRVGGCRSGLVNAGGDLARFGAARCPIVCRQADGTGLLVALRAGALATSDTRASSRPPEHRGYYHAGDPARAIEGRVTVLAARAAVADGLTKCLLGAGSGLERRLLGAFGARRLRMQGPARDRGA